MSISKNDFLFFQNDILKDIKSLENTMNSKVNQINETIITKIKEHESKLSKLTENINELVTKIASNSQANDHIEELLRWKGTTNDSLLDNKTQINLVNRCLSNAIARYDTIIIDNLSLPGVVGINCKFKNLKEYFQFIFSEIKANNIFKEQQLLINKTTKEEFKNLLKKEETELLKFTNKNKIFCENKFQQYEKILEERFNSAQETVQATRVEYTKCTMELIDKTKELQIYYDSLKEIKNEIYQEYEKELSKFKKEVENNNKLFSLNQNDFKLLKQRFTQLSEFIKDVRFQKNIKNKNFENMAKQIDFKRNQKYKNDYNMEIYDEISKDIMSFINKAKESAEEKDNIEVNRRKKRIGSMYINTVDKKKIKTSISQKFRNSTRPNIVETSNKDINKVSPQRKKRNSIAFGQNEFSAMKKKLYDFQNSPEREEKVLPQKKKSSVVNLKTNNENKEGMIISSNKSDDKSSSSSSSSSSSLYSSKSNSSQSQEDKDEKCDSKENKDKNEAVVDNKDKKVNEKKTEYKLDSKINENNKNNDNKKFFTDARIKEIKEEYGNKVKLMSMDLLSKTNQKSKNANKDIFSSYNITYNTRLKLSDTLRRQSLNVTIQDKKNIEKKNFFSNKNLNIKTDNNFIIQKQSNINVNINDNINKIKNKKVFFPSIIINTENKKDKLILNQNYNNTYLNKKNICLTDSKNKSLKNNFFEKNNKNNKLHLLLDKEINKLNSKQKSDIPNIPNINKEENKNANIEKSNNNKNYKHLNLEIQNIEIINIEKIQKNEENKLNQNNNNFENNINDNLNNTINNNIKSINKNDIIHNINFSVKNFTKNEITHNINFHINNNGKLKEENSKENENKNMKNNDNSINSSWIEKEFDKEIYERNIFIINEKINKINVSNEALSTKINLLEDNITPITDQINEIFKIISLIYDTMKKEKNNNQTFTIIHSTTNRINNKINNSLRIGNNIRNNILKEYRTKNGINLLYPYKKEHSSHITDKKNINEENNIIGNNEYTNRLSKDDMNILLRKIEPFLIKKFKKNQE